MNLAKNDMSTPSFTQNQKVSSGVTRNPEGKITGSTGSISMIPKVKKQS